MGAHQLWLFGRNFLKHPRMLGSAVPSSRFLTGRLLRAIDWDRAELIVEYGPGVGTLTAQMLRRMRPGAALVAVETNRDFVTHLRRTLPDPRLHIVHGSAADAAAMVRALGFSRADYVVSGIPYSTMPQALRDLILDRTVELLRPGGTLLVYQFTRVVLPHLRGRFADVQEEFEPLNVMPARLFYCRGNGNGCAPAG